MAGDLPRWARPPQCAHPPHPRAGRDWLGQDPLRGHARRCGARTRGPHECRCGARHRPEGRTPPAAGRSGSGAPSTPHHRLSRPRHHGRPPVVARRRPGCRSLADRRAQSVDAQRFVRAHFGSSRASSPSERWGPYRRILRPRGHGLGPVRPRSGPVPPGPSCGVRAPHR